MSRTLLNANQIRNLFSVERVLAARGFSVLRQKNHCTTILNASDPSQESIETLFSIFDDSQKRYELHKFVHTKKHDPKQIKPLSSIEGAILDLSHYTTTLEWYFGELLVRKFQSLSSAFGVEISDNPNPRNNGLSGDYDVLSVMGDGSILYIECKSGSIGYDDVVKATDRGNSLFTTSTIVTFGGNTTFLHLKSNFDNKPYPGINIRPTMQKIALKGRSESTIYAWNNTYFLPQSSDNVAGLTTILRLITMTRVELLKGFGVDDESYDRLGFTILTSTE